MQDRYQFAEIEARWQQRWRESDLYRTPEPGQKPKYYTLAMFPYPSGDRLHMGHMRVYSIADTVARYQRMQGFAVLHPMGWDAFGLPAENAAIQRGTHPRAWTLENIAYMRQQMDRLGLSYDWDREVSSCEPDYYRWTQWLFLQFHKAGLASRREAAVNWCPGCQTVLANEQAEGGVCWRCDSPVTKKNLEQWFLKITQYAEELLNDLGTLDRWSDRIKTIQRNWIGRSEGTELQFPVAGDARTSITVFTTRPDTTYGVTYMALAPDHPLVEQLTVPQRQAEVRQFQEAVRQQSEIERLATDRPKSGVALGSFAVNPFSGDKVPIWIADYVLLEYGSGAVMGVPAHDERDYAFAQGHKLPIRQVIKSVEQAAMEAAPGYDPKHAPALTAAFVDVGVMMNSGQFDNMVSSAAVRAMTDHAAKQKFGRARISYRLRDWLISRQRYWGAPIPIVYCAKCGTVPVAELDLPVLLPEQVSFSGQGKSPLSSAPEFVNTACPHCQGPAQRETDTMDTFMDSSWYFLRYCDPHNQERAFDPDKTAQWMAVDQYVGGVEHAALHLLYARFCTKFLRDRGFIKVGEPFLALLNQGMVIKDGAKMSKSKGNVVSPDEIVHDYGADTARLYILFAAPPDKDLDWSDEGIKGPHDFLRKTWRVALAILPKYRKGGREHAGGKDLQGPAADLYRMMNRTVKRLGDDLARRYLNTTVSTLMEFRNALDDYLKTRAADADDAWLLSAALENLVLLLAPMAPHISEEIWAALGNEESVHLQSWPSYDEHALLADAIEIAVQFNGKVKERLQVPTPIAQSREDLERFAREHEQVLRHVNGRQVVKIIAVPGRLVNIVLK